MEEWSDSIKIAMDVLIACLIVGALIVCGQISKRVMSAMDEEHASTAEVAEYRIQRMYDGHTCYPQDIVSLILEYQGNPVVNVTPLTGTAMSWTADSQYTELTSAAISAALNQGAVYNCTLTYDKNGSLTAYNFEESA